VKVQLHAFLTSAVGVGEWSASRPSRLVPGTHRKGEGGPHKWSGRGGEEKNSHNAPAGNFESRRPTRSLVTSLTELPGVDTVLTRMTHI